VVAFFADQSWRAYRQLWPSPCRRPFYCWDSTTHRASNDQSKMLTEISAFQSTSLLMWSAFSAVRSSDSSLVLVDDTTEPLQPSSGWPSRSASYPYPWLPRARLLTHVFSSCDE
jgi:hypothetical protein